MLWFLSSKGRCINCFILFIFVIIILHRGFNRILIIDLQVVFKCKWAITFHEPPVTSLLSVTRYWPRES